MTLKGLLLRGAIKPKRNTSPVLYQVGRVPLLDNPILLNQVYDLLDTILDY